MSLESILSHPQIQNGHLGDRRAGIFKLQWFSPNRNNIGPARKVSAAGSGRSAGTCTPG
jgi:hypothetical protein